MKITLFIPCFVDQFHPQAGMGMVRVFERLGHQVEYPPAQTCCGQPPFNAGYWDEARAVARRQMEVFGDAEVVVSASGSCGAMIKIFNAMLFQGRPEEARAKTLAARTFEFSEFLVNRLGLSDVGARFEGRATFHDGCHGLRELGLKKPPRQLLQHVRGLQLVEMNDRETCCGFGGTFAVKFPMISTAMGEAKCAAIAETGADFVISNDSSCLMQLQGILDKQGSRVQTLHLAQVLASA
ncbi:MAG: (Fe-S)-binding protein [Verrucomicrobiota bacterium]